MQNSDIVSHFVGCFRLLNDELRSLKQLNNVFDEETKLYFDDCRNRLELIFQSINDLNGLCVEEKETDEKLSKILTNYVSTPMKPGAKKKDATAFVEIGDSHIENGQQAAERAAGQAETKKVAFQEPPKKSRQNVNFSACLEIKSISDDEFQSVPAYMKGRIRLVQVNQIVEKFNQSLNSKYQLFEKGLKGICRENKEKYLRYKSQETVDTKNQRFCMDDDLKETMTAKEVQVFNKQIVQILRHCKRVKEIRTNQLVRYVLLPH